MSRMPLIEFDCEIQCQAQLLVAGALVLATALMENVNGVENMSTIGEHAMTLLLIVAVMVPMSVEKPPHITDAEQLRCGSVA